MPYLIVEYSHEPPVDDEAIASGMSALKPCLEVRGIRRLRSWLSLDRRRGVCEYEAADTQSLREAYAEANIRCERIWAGDLFEFNAPAVTKIAE